MNNEPEPLAEDPEKGGINEKVWGYYFPVTVKVTGGKANTDLGDIYIEGTEGVISAAGEYQGTASYEDVAQTTFKIVLHEEDTTSQTQEEGGGNKLSCYTKTITGGGVTT